MTFNQNPKIEELPSLSQLFRSAIAAVCVAVFLLITTILPAEYGVDPTGIGRVIGLSEMGEIKSELQREAEEDADTHSSSVNKISFLKILNFSIIPSANASNHWREQFEFELKPGEYHEVKFMMKKGQAIEYAWVGSRGGRVNFDLHGHGNGASATYEKGRGKTEGNGSFSAAFDGEHGWFWRNRDKKPVKIMLSVAGDYNS